jgi:hypothetical protein
MKCGSEVFNVCLIIFQHCFSGTNDCTVNDIACSLTGAT